MPSIVHTLHTILGHPSMTAILEHFQMFYFHRKEFGLIKMYIRDGMTCSYAKTDEDQAKEGTCSEDFSEEKSSDTVSLMDSEKEQDECPIDTHLEHLDSKGSKKLATKNLFKKGVKLFMTRD
jgi:hypothetical protein